MKRRGYRTLIILAAILFFAGCESGDPYVKERAAIQDYLKAHGITAVPKSSGLYYIETKAGTGATPAYGSMVKVKYTGAYTDGTVFDPGTQPYSFRLGFGNVISGWDEGIGYMKEGGKATLIVPSDLGYGPYGYQDIPGYTPLIFDVELVDIF